MARRFQRGDDFQFIIGGPESDEPLTHAAGSPVNGDLDGRFGHGIIEPEARAKPQAALIPYCLPLTAY
jgi:hypothetical protein